MTLKEWAEKEGMNYQTAKSWLQRGKLVADGDGWKVQPRGTRVQLRRDQVAEVAGEVAVSATCEQCEELHADRVKFAQEAAEWKRKYERDINLPPSNDERWGIVEQKLDNLLEVVDVVDRLTTERDRAVERVTQLEKILKAAGKSVPSAHGDSALNQAPKGEWEPL